MLTTKSTNTTVTVRLLVGVRVQLVGSRRNHAEETAVPVAMARDVAVLMEEAGIKLFESLDVKSICDARVVEILDFRASGPQFADELRALLATILGEASGLPRPQAPPATPPGAVEPVHVDVPQAMAAAVTTSSAEQPEPPAHRGLLSGKPKGKGKR